MWIGWDCTSNEELWGMGGEGSKVSYRGGGLKGGQASDGVGDGLVVGEDHVNRDNKGDRVAKLVFLVTIPNLFKLI